MNYFQISTASKTGKYLRKAADVTIPDADIHDFVLVETKAKIGKNFVAHDYAQVLNGAKIGDNVHLGKYSQILPGIEIGKNVIVHERAVVGKNVKDNEIIIPPPTSKYLLESCNPLHKMKDPL